MISLPPVETKLELILNSLQTGAVLYQPIFSDNNTEGVPADFGISFSNHQTVHLAGVAITNLKGKRVLSLTELDENSRRNLFQQLKEVYTTGKRSVIYSHSTAMNRHFQQISTKIDDAVLTEVKDITAEVLERKERERQTALSSQILDQSINAWFTCEAVRNGKGDIVDLLITRINPAFIRIIRLPEEKVLGKSFLSVFPTAKENGTFEMHCRVLQTGVAERRLIQYIGDGLDAWYEAVANKLGADSILITFADFSILGKAPYGVIQYHAVRDESGNVIDFVHRTFNAVALQLSGFTFKELSSKTARELCILRNNMMLFENSVQVMESGQPIQFEYYVAISKAWVRFSIVPFGDGVLMNFIDITERIVQEKKVQEKADQLARIMDASLNAIYTWKAVRNEEGAIVDMRYTMINKRFKTLLGRSEDEVIGKTVLELYPGLIGTELFQRYISVVETGEPALFEDYYKGEELDMWFEASAVSMGEDEVVIGFRDITAQKKSALKIQEQHTLLDSILTNSPSGIVVVRMMRDERGVIKDGKVVLMNNAAEKYTQYPKEIMLTKTSVEMEPHILESPLYQRVGEIMETGEPFQMHYQMEMTGQWVEMNVARIDKDHLVNVFTDVTEQKNYLLRQDKMLHDFKRSNEALEEFTRAASHDLKEPIRKVHYFVTRLKSELHGTLNPAQLNLFERVEKSTNRMRLLIDDLLDYSHLNTPLPEKETIDLNEKLSNVLNDLELFIQEKNAKVLVGQLPTINGYRRQLQQLFQNLITNSLKYSKKDVVPEIKIAASMVSGKDSGLSVQPKDSEHMFHLIEISDNGIGFDPKDAERIFDVFTRLHGNKEYPGTGIGLSIARKVVENHGGYIEAESEPGNGAKFKVLLPVSSD